MFWLFREVLRELGIKGIVLFIVVVTLMPIGALWIAISQRAPAFLLVIPAWIIAIGVPNDWFTNPFDGSPLSIIGPLVYVVSWLVVVGGSFALANEGSS